ncbi:GNAT family N-acetyltransferase [Candidatus Bathyarchaeota archaeon]|nr:GNAT family N-acetyltransferase [Candidatus Bathyarchaeota archaeon]
MDKLVPLFEDALKAAEKKLGDSQGERCSLKLYTHMGEHIQRIVEMIDHEKFRSELQYAMEEIRARGRHHGFMLFLLTCEGEPMAYLYGYMDPDDKSTFYIDTVTTLQEGKGFGSMLVTLSLVFCVDTGYSRAKLSTEELDEKERHLVKFYGDLGFGVVTSSSEGGVTMESKLEPDRIRDLCKKHLGLEAWLEEWNP